MASSDAGPERRVVVDVWAEKEVDQLEQTIIALHWLYHIDRLANGKGDFVDPPFHLNLIGPRSHSTRTNH